MSKMGNAYIEKMERERGDEECPNIRYRKNGDDALVWCELEGHTCIMEHHPELGCEEYKQYLEED